MFTFQNEKCQANKYKSNHHIKLTLKAGKIYVD